MRVSLAQAAVETVRIELRIPGVVHQHPGAPKGAYMDRSTVDPVLHRGDELDQPNAQCHDLGPVGSRGGDLVDDVTVEIENIHRNLGQGKSIIRAILDGAQQIATHPFVSTLSICIVFVPMVFLTGAVQSLFTPLAMAVVVAMMASYLLSRTLIPTLVRYFLRSEVQLYQHSDGDQGAAAQRLIWNIHHRFNRGFERFRGRYRHALAWAVQHRAMVAGLAAAFFGGSLVLIALCWARLLTTGRCRPVSLAYPRARRDAHRRDGAAVQPDGFLRRRLVDIGDRVRAGSLLAEIDTPELDQ